MTVTNKERFMRVAVIGAAGRTGRHVVEQALARGDEAIAVVRDPQKLGVQDPGLRVVASDVRDRTRVVEALRGADAVVSALGTGSSRAATDVYSVGVENELAAMRVNGIERLAVISAAPVGPRDEQAFLDRRIAMPLLERFFGALYADMRRMESVLAASQLNWVALRPPRLVAKPAQGTYRLDTKPLAKARTLTYADLATALLDSLSRDDLVRRAAYVAN
jgi:putative NADH-flavin reductase